MRCFDPFTNKNGQARIKKIIKILMDFFLKIKFLTENPINYDVAFSAIHIKAPCAATHLETMINQIIINANWNEGGHFYPLVLLGLDFVS